MGGHGNSRILSGVAPISNGQRLKPRTPSLRDTPGRRFPCQRGEERGQTGSWDKWVGPAWGVRPASEVRERHGRGTGQVRGGYLLPSLALPAGCSNSIDRHTCSIGDSNMGFGKRLPIAHAVGAFCVTWELCSPPVPTRATSLIKFLTHPSACNPTTPFLYQSLLLFRNLSTY